ncbi:branched-chain amino acid transport system II carrier protein [Ruminococcus gauvreauii]|uniref:branched-chain amino acid transport system II carrier protein n=1 Tax=Ruminococcus gauvreauii TaxID=438033 RepID=UPI00398434D2
MKEKLNFRQYLTIASMLFGLFFGAGNLIFPALMGQMAGRNVWPAIAGFLITGVGLPLLGVIALGNSRCSGLTEMSQRIGRRYGVFFTCALYLTIGPFFAIPRCATVPFAVGIDPLLSQGSGSAVPLAVFSLVFFGIVLYFSLRPGEILTWVGKVLNPLFLIFLGVLMLTALCRPAGNVSSIIPETGYSSGAFFNGFLEGYNTMDALAGLAFGIIVVNVIRGLGVKQPGNVARCTVKAGVLSSLIMAAIYLIVTIAGTQSRGLSPLCDNGGEVLTFIARHYYGTAGAVILALTVTFACLKTSIGLITSCSETFVLLFPEKLSYRGWAAAFSFLSFLIANLGLDLIIRYSLPVLMLLYPLAITLILLCLFGRIFGNARCVYASVTVFTFAAALLDFIAALPEQLQSLLHTGFLISAARQWLPLFDLGLGWLLPAILGLFTGLIINRRKQVS